MKILLVVEVAPVTMVVTSVDVVLFRVEAPPVSLSTRDTPLVDVVVSSVGADLGFVRRLVAIVVRVKESSSAGVEGVEWVVMV